MARRDRFKRVIELGPVIQRYRWGRVQIGQSSPCHWSHGEVVDISIHGKTYAFGKDITKMVKQHYC